MLKRTVVGIALAIVAGGYVHAQPPTAQTGPLKTVAVRAGRIVDPETGAVASNQVILIQGERINAIGPNVTIPPAPRSSICRS